MGSWISSETDTSWEEKVEEVKKEKEQPRRKTEAEKKGKDNLKEPKEDVRRTSYQVHEVQLDNKNPFGRSLNFFEGNETKDEYDLRLELEKRKKESNLQHVNHKAKTNFLDEITKTPTKNEFDFEAEMRKPSDDLNLLPKTKKSYNRTNRPSNIKDCVEM